MKRPSEMRSSVAVVLAVVMGSRSITRHRPVAILRRVVAVAAIVSATNSSRLCQYASVMSHQGPSSLKAHWHMAMVADP